MNEQFKQALIEEMFKQKVSAANEAFETVITNLTRLGEYRAVGIVKAIQAGFLDEEIK